MSGRDQQDVAAFSQFVEARSASLFRTAYLVIGDYQLAQDLLQDALVRAYVSWSRLRDVANAEAYTRRIIVTTAISWRRRRSFHERPVGDVPDAGVVADEIDRLGTRDELWRELHRLPPRQRVAVVLRFCEDLSEVKTAELMDCSVGSVKRQVFVGLGKLREALGSDFIPPTPAVTA